MRKKLLLPILAGFAILTAVSLVLTFVVFNDRAPDTKGLVAVSNNIPPAPDGASEGIAVHGHWTIEVRNPDGSLAERRDFENELLPSGDLILTRLLCGQKYITGLAISLSGDVSTSPFLDDAGVNTVAFIVDSSWTRSGRECFKNLRVLPMTSGDNSFLYMSGTANAHRDGTIFHVGTKAWLQNVSEAPGGHYIGESIFLTTKGLSSPVTLTAGQTVTVTVEISFS